MKKKYHTIIGILVIINIILIILIGLILSRNISFNNNYSNNKMTISMNELMNLYKEKLNSYVPDHNMDIQIYYSIIDINKDNIPELVIKSGSAEADYKFIFYTYNENNDYYAFDDYVVYAGTSDGGHSSLYEMNNKNYLMNIYAHMGAESVSYLTLENDWIVEKRISQRITEDEYKSGDKYIKLVDYKDTSLFDSYK